MMTNDFLSRVTESGDGARLGAQVISGIGFLGAGTILVTSRNQIRGLTTAASLWACACLGLAIGTGFYTLSIFSTIVITIVLAILPKIEELFTKRSLYFEIHIEFQTRENLKLFVNTVRQWGLTFFPSNTIRLILLPDFPFIPSLCDRPQRKNRSSILLESICRFGIRQFR